VRLLRHPPLAFWAAVACLAAALGGAALGRAAPELGGPGGGVELRDLLGGLVRAGAAERVDAATAALARRVADEAAGRGWRELAEAAGRLAGAEGREGPEVRELVSAVLDAADRIPRGGDRP
jgi:hypothetical protein